MSENLYYDRGENITGVDLINNINAYSPTYGSQVAFQSKNYSFLTDNFYSETIPESTNNLTASFSLRYEMPYLDCQKMANFVEKKSGILPIEFSPDNQTIYNSLSGYCENYAINHQYSGHYGFAAEIMVDQHLIFQGWSGNGIINYDFENWSNSKSYEKDDIVYLAANENKLKNFYYCTGDHNSTALNSPTGDSSMWTQNFYWSPDNNLTTDSRINVVGVEYQNSFKQRFKAQKNTVNTPISYSFSNISNKQSIAILHFLENKGGYRLFRNDINSVFNRPKVFMCPTWTHEWVHFDSNNISVTLIEDKLGVIGEN